MPRKAKTLPKPEGPGVLYEVSFLMIACCLIFLTAVFVRTLWHPPVCTNGPLLLQTDPPKILKHKHEVKPVPRPGE